MKLRLKLRQSSNRALIHPLPESSPCADRHTLPLESSASSVFSVALGGWELTESKAWMGQAALRPISLFCSWRWIPKGKGQGLQFPRLCSRPVKASTPTQYSARLTFSQTLSQNAQLTNTWPFPHQQARPLRKREPRHPVSCVTPVKSVTTYRAPVCRPCHGDHPHHAVHPHPVLLVTKCTPQEDGWHRVRLQPTPSFPFCIKHEPLGDKVTSQDYEESPQQSQGLGGASEGNTTANIQVLPRGDQRDMA